MTLDEKEKPQDNTSEDTPGTSEKEPETLTDEDKITKAVSDALSAAGRDAKTMEVREGKVKDALAKAEKLQVAIKVDADKRAEQKYRDDLEKAGDDSLQRSKVELNRDLRLARVELEDANTKSKQKDDKILQLEQTEAVSTKERNARVIASKYGVDPETLKLTDGSAETMEALAKKLSGKEAPTLKPDGSKTSRGSGGIPTNIERFREWVAGLSQDEFEKLAPEINKMKREGKIK